MEMTQVSQCQVIQDRSLSLPYSELVEMFFLSQTTGAFFPTAFFLFLFRFRGDLLSYGFELDTY